MPLPDGLAVKVTAGTLPKGLAIERAVASKMRAWDRSWEASKRENQRLRAIGKVGSHAENMEQKVDQELADRRTTQEPIDWFLSVQATANLLRLLIALDPRYEALLKKAREAYREIKTQHYIGGFKLTLNELLWDFERKEFRFNREKPTNALVIQNELVAEFLSNLSAEIPKLSELLLNLSGPGATKVEIGLARLIQAPNGWMCLSPAAETDVGRVLVLGVENDALCNYAKQLLALNQQAKTRPALQTPAFSQQDRPKYTAEEVINAVQAGNDAVAAGKDLSGLTDRQREIVEIKPAERVKKVQTAKGLVAQLDDAGKEVMEPNPFAGKVGLTPSAYQSVNGVIFTSTKALENKDIKATDKELHTRKLSEYEEAFKVVRTSMGITNDKEDLDIEISN